MFRKSIHAVTLIEFLIALSVFSVGLLALSHLMIDSHRHLNNALQQSLATQQGINVAERLRMDPLFQQWLPRDQMLSQGSCNVHSGEDKHYEVTVRWQNNLCVDPRQRQLKFEVIV